jgi:hypothetical protein
MILKKMGKSKNNLQFVRSIEDSSDAPITKTVIFGTLIGSKVKLGVIAKVVTEPIKIIK